ncbi:polyhydroxyalkanoate synthesis repressor PhaR [Sphingomonas glaciei]|uniref:Polyhydroxyalkanoate synthesis repressor PhaR n=1 Tax=Sphingomonas glaciei TaxID=2938948 RepID=A0ABY5MVA0_9SPHN|nr:polyhydroxyalkanoate synthesis repressor PhaR [Sphingomonas glaciei]UUR08409.1 polyhydroxyalkanoate synthesis repressor PhaR [Sphingomonas glaciei]
MNAPSHKITIKKYANRRLYDTESSTYVTLDRLAQMIREGRDFVVVDAKTGEDITHQALTQIIVEEEARGGATMLPAGFLRQVIALYGNSMQTMVPGYLDAAMQSFSKNQAAFKDAFGSNLFADMAKRQMALFEQSAKVLTGATPPRAAPAAATPSDDQDEVAALKAELDALRTKVDKLVR